MEILLPSLMDLGLNSLGRLITQMLRLREGNGHNMDVCLIRPIHMISITIKQHVTLMDVINSQLLLMKVVLHRPMSPTARMIKTAVWMSSAML